MARCGTYGATKHNLNTLKYEKNNYKNNIIARIVNRNEHNLSYWIISKKTYKSSMISHTHTHTIGLLLLKESIFTVWIVDSIWKNPLILYIVKHLKNERTNWYRDIESIWIGVHFSPLSFVNLRCFFFCSPTIWRRKKMNLDKSWTLPLTSN